MMICKMILTTPRASPPRPTSLGVEAALATLGHSSVATLMTVGGRRIAHAKEIEDAKMIVTAAMIADMIACARRTAGMTVDAKMIVGIAVMTVAMTVDAKMIAGITVIAMMTIVVMEETGIAEAMMISVMVGVAVKGRRPHPLLM
jgi:hypothetical protein